jgi:SAM-dependent methyltransferase
MRTKRDMPSMERRAKDLARQFRIGPKIRLEMLKMQILEMGNCGAMVVESVFEHANYWETGLRNIYRALRPGGFLFLWFERANKFNLISCEFNLTLYRRPLNRVRYETHIWEYVPKIRLLRIDFHQFAFLGLERYFRVLGFSGVLDLIEFAEIKDDHSWLRRKIMAILKKFEFCVSYQEPFYRTIYV